MLASLVTLLLAAAPEAAPASKPAPPATAVFTPKTLVEGETLQVVLGQRAVFLVDDKGQPVLDEVQEGQLAAAHPPGEASETFKAPGAPRLAAALDGSAEVKATKLKVWNDLDHPVAYKAMVLVLETGGKLKPVPVSPCPVPAHGVRTESWPAPIVAVGLARFKTADKQALARADCKTGG